MGGSYMGMPVSVNQENRSLTIKLRKRKPEKKVEWTSDTVDNEHMGRRSSKCECVLPTGTRARAPARRLLKPRCRLGGSLASGRGG